MLISGQRASLLACYITDRNQFAGSAEDKERRLLKKIAECAGAGVDFIQLRETDLSGREFDALARKAMAVLRDGSPAKLLINARLDVALACRAHGVHLPAGDLLPSEIRTVWDRVSRAPPVVGISIHFPEEAARAEAHGADFAVYGPVFEKGGEFNPRGLGSLRQACRGLSIPVLALGGVTLSNARQCLEAGAAGLAGIRLFQENAVKPLLDQLRCLLG